MYILYVKAARTHTPYIGHAERAVLNTRSMMYILDVHAALSVSSTNHLA